LFRINEILSALGQRLEVEQEANNSVFDDGRYAADTSGDYGNAAVMASKRTIPKPVSTAQRLPLTNNNLEFLSEN
jgi:hypothetical protein